MKNLKVYVVSQNFILILFLSIFLSFSCHGRITTEKTGEIEDIDISDSDSEYNEDYEECEEYEEEPEAVEDYDHEDNDENEESDDIPDEDNCVGEHIISDQSDLKKLLLCKHISGNILIEKTPFVELILPELETVEGDITIFDNLLLETVSLPKLQHVYGSIIFGVDYVSWPGPIKIFNPLLSTISMPELSSLDTIHIGYTLVTEIAFPKLENIRKTIKIWGNDMLEIVALPNLNKVSEDLLFCSEIPVIEVGWGQVTVNYYHIGNSLLKTIYIPELKFIERTLQIRKNPELEEISLKKLRVLNRLDVSDNKNLKILSVPEIEIMEYGLVVSNNSHLSTLDINKVKSVGEELAVSWNNPEPISFPLLETTGNFTINTNNFNTPVTASSLKTIQGSLNIFAHEINFPVLKSIEKHLLLYNSAHHFTILSIEKIGRDLIINKSANTEKVELPNLKELGGNIIAKNTRSLQSIIIPDVKVVNGSILISDNDSFKDLIMPELNKIEESLEFINNSSLETINLLIYSIGSDFKIINNSALENIHLPSLSKIKKSFTVTDNPELPSWIATELYYQVKDREGIGGTVLIEGNKE